MMKDRPGNPRANKARHMSPEQKVLTKDDLIRKCSELISLRLEGNLTEVVKYFAPDARLRIAGSSTVSPLSSVCVGHQQILEKIRTMNVLIEYCEIEPQAYVVDEDHFVVRWTGRWRNRGTGPAENLEGVAHVRFRDGLIVDYTNFVDTAIIADMLGWPVRTPEE
jgi:ketosteroid isomerase-like protein